jgi:hypothetical protein
MSIHNVNRRYLRVISEAVSCCEHPETVEDRSPTEVPRLDLDAHQPGPGPNGGLPTPNDARSTRPGNQAPLPTACYIKYLKIYQRRLYHLFSSGTVACYQIVSYLIAYRAMKL